MRCLGIVLAASSLCLTLGGLIVLGLMIPAAAQQIKTGEDYALQLQRTYQHNGYDVEVAFYHSENTLAVRSDEFKDSGTREAIVRELTRDTKTMCGLGIWYVRVGYSKGFFSGDVMKTASVGCPAAKAAHITETAGAREEIANALNDPDGTGHIHARVDGVTLVLISEYYFDSPQRRSMGIQAISDVLSKQHQKLCDADFANIQFKGKNPVKIVPVRCK